MAVSATVTLTRMHDVLDAIASVSADLSMDSLLNRIVGLTAELAGARYGYLDVLDRRADRRLGQSASFGVDEAELWVSGPLPPGCQVLVDLIRHPEFNDVSRSTGHGVAEFICVPIQIQGYRFGNLYLTGKIGEEGFSLEDNAVALALASAAGVVIENARLHEQGDRQSRWLEAAADVTATLLGPISDATALQLVADRMRDEASADFVALLMSAGADALVVETVSGIAADGVLGEHIDPAHSMVADAVRTRTTIVVPDTAVEPRYAPHKTLGWPDLGSIMVLPLSSGTDRGALIVGWLKGYQMDRWQLDPAWPQWFADQAALVLQAGRAQKDRGRLAVFEDRDRIGRDLHDLVIQRLFAIGLMLDKTSKVANQPDVETRISEAVDDIDATIKDIRRTIFTLNSEPCSDDLRVLLGDAMDRSADLLGFRPVLVFQGPIDSFVADAVSDHLLAVVGEALSNVVRHANSSRVVVSLSVGEMIDLTVTDDGRGLGAKRSGSGLRNMRRRAELLGGTCSVRSVSGSGVELRWSVPAVNA